MLAVVIVLLIVACLGIYQHYATEAERYSRELAKAREDLDAANRHIERLKGRLQKRGGDDLS